MPQHQNDQGGIAKLALTLIGGCVIVLAAWMWFSRTPVKLSQDQYETTLALYRICNQKSDEGIAEIERLLTENKTLADSDLPSAMAIRQIIDDAKQQRWDVASQNCRLLLEDQIEY